MPKVMVNGKEYCGGGGGGDNSQTLTFEAYQALPEETRKNGTTYYVPDAPGEVTGDSVKASNMYYDPATDIKYLKNQGGEWVPVGYGGLITDFIYDSGKVYRTLYTAVGNLGTSGTTTLEENHVLLTANGSASNGRRQGVRTEEKFDLTDVEVIYLDYEVISGTQNVYIVVQPVIVDTEDFSGNNPTARVVLPTVTAGTGGTLKLNVSNISGSYYLYFGIVGQSSDSKTKLYKMYCK